MASAGVARTTRYRRVLFAASAVILLAVLLLTLRHVGPAVPGEVQLLTGPADSRYHEVGQRYAAYLRERGLRAQVVQTEGSFDNLLRLASQDASMAGFVQSAVDHEVADQGSLANLVSLGSLYFEPFWVFVRSEIDADDLADLEGRRIARGHPGGGARAVAQLLLDGVQVSKHVISAPYDNLDPDAAADALLAGEIDAACFVGEPRSPTLSRLIEADAVRPVSFRRAAAFAELYPSLAELSVPEGAFDLARNLPSTELKLLAPAANLVTRSDLHPAVVDLLLDAAGQMQRGPTPVARRGSFPSSRYVSLPLSPAAARFYKEGPSKLRKILPFRLATAIDRFTVVLLPVLTVAFGLFKLLPILIQARFKLQSQLYYKRLARLEKDAAEGEDHASVLARLDAIDRESAALAVPRPCLTPFLELRQYLHDMRERLKET